MASTFFRERRFIGGGDRRAVSDAVWSVIRHRRRLEWWLDRAGAPAPTARLLLAADRLLDGEAPDTLAAVFAAGGRHGAGSLDPDEMLIARALAGHTLDHPAMPDPVRHEVPDWLMPRLAARFGATVAAELAALRTEAPLDLRCNLLRGDRDAAVAALAADGIVVVPTPHSPWGLRAAARQHVTASRAFRDGLVEIQDEASQLAARAVGAMPGMRVCDLCAGAGGKTLALAMTMDNRGHIVACDTSAVRLEGATRRLRRAGVHNCERHLLEAGDRWAKRRAGSFDRVLVDAPCTGTGTWRRNPDARRRLAETDLAELVVKQAALLEAGARLVRPGGRLVYATCSILPDENEHQLERFRADHPAFAPVPIETLGLPGRGDALVLTPRRHGTDGFYVAVLARDGGPGQ